MVNDVVPRAVICKSALNKTGIPGYEYCMNPYVGCTHACLYCYASFMCRFSVHPENWGSFLDVKANLPEVLVKQLSSRKPPKGKVLLGSVTDAYQPAESTCRITRSALEILAEYELLEVHILTKSALVQRDLPVLRRLRACEVGFTITTLDPGIAAVMEPGASPPRLRIEAARQLIEAGIPVWVFIAPLLPGVTDSEESLTALIRTIAACGIRDILLDRLNPYPAVVQRLRRAYRQYFPQAWPALEEYLRFPEISQARIEDLLDKISRSAGCRPYFV